MRKHKKPSWIYGAAAAAFSSARRDNNNNLTSRKRFPLQGYSLVNGETVHPKFSLPHFNYTATSLAQTRAKHKSRESRQLYVKSLAKLGDPVRDTLVRVFSATLVSVRLCGAQV